jgi:hypothetical protein
MFESFECFGLAFWRLTEKTVSSTSETRTYKNMKEPLFEVILLSFENKRGTRASLARLKNASLATILNYNVNFINFVF